MEIELLIGRELTLYAPVAIGSITWATERSDAPGKLMFTVLRDEVLQIQEGDAVRLSVDGVNIFFGFLFTMKSKEDKQIDCTAYDQMRYLKNKDTAILDSARADERIRQISERFSMQCGDLENTGWLLPPVVADNEELFETISNALGDTLLNTSKLFVLYDDYGKLCLRNPENWKIPIIIDAETAQSYSYTSSIDSDTYNKIKLYLDNEESGKREIYIAQSGMNINQWGILQYVEELKKGENGQAKADALLGLYNRKTKNLSINKCLGDSRVRAGCLVIVHLDLGDVKIQSWMLVEKCKHTFKNEEHFMDLELKGGEEFV